MIFKRWMEWGIFTKFWIRRDSNWPSGSTTSMSTTGHSSSDSISPINSLPVLLTGVRGMKF